MMVFQNSLQMTVVLFNVIARLGHLHYVLDNTLKQQIQNVEQFPTNEYSMQTVHNRM